MQELNLIMSEINDILSQLANKSQFDDVCFCRRLHDQFYEKVSEAVAMRIDNLTLSANSTHGIDRH